MKCRVVFKPDGKVSIIYPAPKSRRADESERDWLNRVLGKSMGQNGFVGLDFVDMDASLLPGGDREKWRRNGNSIIVDDTVVTKAEQKKAVEDELDAELDLETPDVAKALRLQRKLDKKDYS